MRESQIDQSQAKCETYGFKHSLRAVNVFDRDEITYFDFKVKRENMSLRNVYGTEDLEIYKNIKDLEHYYTSFNLSKCLFQSINFT